MSTEHLERAFVSTRAVLDDVTDEQLGDPTPCQSWDVRALVNHIVGGAFFFGAAITAGREPEQPEGERPDLTAGGHDAWMTAFDSAAEATVAAFGAEGALEKTVVMPFGELPGEVFIGIAATDTFAHGWDLAKATGQPTDLDPELAAILLERAKLNLPDSFRGADGERPFGPAVPVDETAPAADRLAAFLGRRL